MFADILDKRKDGTTKKRRIKVLLDSGASQSLVNAAVIRTYVHSADMTSWTTAAGTFRTNRRSKLAFKLPELSMSATISHHMHVHDGQIGRYDMVIRENSFRVSV